MWKTVLSREVSEEDPDKKKAKDEKNKETFEVSWLCVMTKRLLIKS